MTYFSYYFVLTSKEKKSHLKSHQFTCSRSIIPPMNHMKRQNGQISPRDMHSSSGTYSNHQTYHHYSTQNHSNSSSSSSSSYSSSNHQKPHPNSDLIDFVHGAWKEKVSLNLIEHLFAEFTVTNFFLCAYFRAHRRSSKWRPAKSIVTLISTAGCEHGSSTRPLKMNRRACDSFLLRPPNTNTFLFYDNDETSKQCES